MTSAYRVVLATSLVILLWGLSLQKAAIAQTGDSPTSFAQGVEFAQQEKYQSALQAFSQAIQNHQNEAAAYANRCWVHLHLNANGAAVQDCSQAVQQDPTNGEAYLNRGLAQYRLGHYGAAIADNTQLLQFQPDLRAYFNRGLAEAALGQPDQAIADYNRALQQALPTDLNTRSEIEIETGLAWVALAQLDQAIPAFDTAIQLNPVSDRAYYSRGCTLGKQGDYLAAIQDLDQALQLNPNLPEAHLDRALAYYNLGNPDWALEDLHQAAQAFQTQHKARDYQQALNLIRQIQRSQSETSQVG